MSRKPNILVAEDNPALSAVIRFNLARGGFEVTCAKNGREAWEVAQKTQFDLVVTDHQMPEMTGLELCEKLRAEEKYKQTPIIMLTAKGLELDRQELQESLNISLALPKPFSPAELVQTVHNCLEQESLASV